MIYVWCTTSLYVLDRQLDTSTTPLPMRYASMGYTSMGFTVHYTVKKANGNQRCDRNFPLPLLENPIRGSEQK
jgi:hypothetical protein